MWTYGDVSPIIKVIMLVLAVVLARVVTKERIEIVHFAKWKFRWLAARPWRCGLTIFLTSICVNLIFTLVHYPEPRVHDEFAYLLGSDTFASGRLTNEPHSHWQHFESFHIINQPSYTAKYPPGTALMLAAGQKLTGHPITGAWLAFALACAGCYWMFRVWTSGQWAALGGMLLALNGPLIKAWGQSYWGGSVALLGGALLFGGLRRICTSDGRPRIRDAVLLGSGLVILANSRPMEGFLCAVPVIAILLVWFVRSRESSWAFKSLGIATPIIAIGLGGLFLMTQYNRVVTNDPLKMPYQLHDQTYSQSAMLIWKTPPEAPSYNHPRMEQFYREWGRERQLSMRDPVIYVRQLSRKLGLLWRFLPIGIGLTLLPIFMIWRDRWTRLAIAVFAMLVLLHTQFAASWIYPHYLAPALALFMAVNLECLRYLQTWNRQQKWGLVLTRVVLILAFMKIVPTLLTTAANDNPTPRQLVCKQIAADELASPQKEGHLVICTSDEDYPIVNDWVYNSADIDGSRIVWARELGQAQNAKLFEYFSNRKVWRLHLDRDENMTLLEVVVPGSGRDTF